MELWVRSQDREALTKVNMGVMYWEDVNKRNCIVNKDNATGFSILGAYKTKERALEVLDEIQKLIQPTFITTGYDCKCEENPFDKLSFNLEMTPTKTEVKELLTYVYEMPED